MNKLYQFYRSSFSGLPRSVWLLCLVMLVHRSGTMVVPFLGLYLTTEEGFRMQTAGWVLAAHGAGGALGVAVAGLWTDRLGPRPVILASLFSSGVFLILVGQVSGLLAIALLAALVGFTADALRPSISAAVANAAPPELRTKAFALLRLAINAALTLGPAVGGLLAKRNYELLFWVDGLTALGAGCLMVRLLPAQDRPPQTSERPTFGRTFATALADPVLLRFLVCSSLLGLAFFQVFSTLPLFLEQERGYAEDGIGLILGSNTLLIVLLEVPLIHALRKLAPLRISTAGALCIAFGFGATELAHGLLPILFTIALWTAGEMLVFPVAMAWISSRATEANRGSLLSAYVLSNALPSIVAPLLGTWIYESFGSAALWTFCLAAGLLAAAGFRSLAESSPG